MNLFQQLLSENRIRVIVIDGLDGSGKGTLVSEIAKLAHHEGDNVLIVDYPQYESHWGKALKFLLKVNDMGLTLEERMAVYSLNRLESVDEIFRCVDNFANKDLNLTLLFDRFATSNLLTLAYYLSKNELAEISLESLEESIKFDLTGKREMMLGDQSVNKGISLIKDLDSSFYSLLGLENPIVTIPQINPRISLKRISGDETRDGHDLYENLRVQMIADYLYQKASTLSEFNIEISFQEGRNPDEIANDIFARYKRDLKAKNSGEVKTVNLNETPIISFEVERCIDDILNKYPRLKTLVDDIKKI